MKYLLLLLALASCAPVDHRDTARVYVDGVLVMTTRVDVKDQDQVIHPPIYSGWHRIRVDVSDEHGKSWEIGTGTSFAKPGTLRNVVLRWEVAR